MYRLCPSIIHVFFMFESLLCYMYLINNDFLYILFPTILYLMIPSRCTCSISVNDRYLVQYIYLFTGINCCKISQVHAVFGLFYHFMHMYMLMYFKLQTIFIHICTCILNFRPYWITCGPASFTCLLSSVVQRQGKNYW